MTSIAPDEHAPWVRITGIILMALAVSVAAIFLGKWQFHRYDVRADALHEYKLGQEVEPQPLADLIPPGSDELPVHVQWREATLVGHFDPDSTTVLRNRSVDATPSWQYLTWFDTDDGRSMLINVGWVPLPGQDAEPEPIPYPTTESTITVIVRTWEDDDGRTGQGATRITPAQLPDAPQEPVPGYGMLREICTNGDCADVLIGGQTPLPSLSTGPHLSYAWQWFVLAAMSPLGAVIMIRREREEISERATRPRRKRQLSDEEVEDAL